MNRTGLFLAVLAVAASCGSCATRPHTAANPGNLHLAAQSGDMAGIDAALKSGSGVDQPDGHGKTPLLYAAALPNLPVVRYLLDKGADPNHVAADGDTPLLVASRKANLPAVELLIQRGARIDALGEDGYTALTIATDNANRDLFDFLLKHDARPNASLANSDTALIRSIAQKDPYFFERLLAAGADPNRNGRAGNTPLIIATYCNKPEIVDKLLSQGARVGDVNDAGYSALFFAVGIEWIRPDLVMRLVEAGGDVNRTARDGLTPLKAACQAGHPDMVVYLYEKGANASFPDSSGEGIELNGQIHHILGDYFLARDDFNKARASFGTALDLYRKTADRYRGDVKTIEWKQTQAVMLQGMVDSLQASAASMQANMQSRQFGQISAMKHAEQTRTGFQGYHSYLTKYGQPYVPTYQGVNMAPLRPPPVNTPLETKKAYANGKARQFEDRSTLVGKVLDCFERNPNGGAALHACVDTVTGTFRATGKKKE